MKKNKFYFFIAIFAAIVTGQTVNAQSNAEEIELFQSIFGMEKKQIVADFTQLDSNNAFWPLYDEYETKRKNLGKARIQALSDYADNYDNMDDLKADETIKSMIDLRKKTDKLTDDYYKKIKKASGSKVAAQFFQLESYFLSAIRLSILEEIPFIGELDE